MDLPTYYRQTGVGGRDNKPCLCVCFYSPGDVLRLLPLAFAEQESNPNYNWNSFWSAIAYCQDQGDTQDCRKSILSSLNERYDHVNCHEEPFGLPVDATNMVLDISSILKTGPKTFSECVSA
jgi:superfamily II DNA helicase RecQ